MALVRVTSIRAMRVPLEMRNPLRTSHGAHAEKIATLVEITTDDGVVGWGENVAPRGVDYVGENADQSYTSMAVCAELVAQRDLDVHEMFAESWWGVANRNFAKHALESALWDAHARSLGVSLAHVLGSTRSTVTPGVVVGLHDSVASTINTVVQHRAEGYQRIKLKIEKGRDIDVVRAVREAVGNDVLLQVDANGAYSRDDFGHLARLDEFDLQFIEQPLAAGDLEGHALLRRQMRTAVCLDESIENCDDLMRAIESEACTVVNVKPSRVGGISDAVRMHNIVLTHGIDAWMGGMLETGIGRASCLAVASLPGFSLTPDLSASSRYFERDVTEPFELHNGEIAVPNRVGIGVEPLPWVFEHPDLVIETLFQA